MSTELVTRNSFLLVYGIPLLLILICVAIGLSSIPVTYPEMAVGVTIDLTISAPLIYLLLIRKTDIPKITVIPFFTGGILIASYILPIEQQYSLGMIKLWLLPVVELVALFYIGSLVRKTVRKFRNKKRQQS